MNTVKWKYSAKWRSSLNIYILCAAGFLAAVSAAFLFRWYHFSAEAERFKGFMPFTYESAMVYSYALSVAKGEGIPEHDKLLAGLEDVKVSEQFPLGIEYFLGWGYRLKNLVLPGRPPTPEEASYEDNPDFSSWIRFQIRLWVSLAAGFIFLWLMALRCPFWLSLAGSLIYAASPAAVSRATGQDLICELMAMPFITASFFLYFWHLRRPRPFKLILFGAALFLALATWDMTQLVLAAWMLYELLRLALGGVPGRKRMLLNLWAYVAAALAGIAVPYLRYHGFVLSPAMAMIFPSLLILAFLSRRGDGSIRRLLLALACAAVFAGAWFAVSKASSYGENYSHFASLLKAKIKFRNVLPADPNLLDFDARILWTPALHSADMGLTRNIFPAAPYVLVLLLGTAFAAHRTRKSLLRGAGLWIFPAAMAAFFFILYVMMVRFHVLCIIFLCIALPLVFHCIHRALRRRWAKALLASAAVLVVIAEVDVSARLVQEGGRSYSREYPVETIGLIQWLRGAHLDGTRVLAEFTISPMLKAYCGTGIVLQPKFEIPRTRNDVEEYLRELYHGDEKSFHRFCVDKGAKFFVFDRGTFGDMLPYSSRYCAAAPRIETSSLVYRMYYKKEKSTLRGFHEIEPPPDYSFISMKYSLFKVITQDEVTEALRLEQKARALMKERRLDEARKLAERAVYLDPRSYKARILYAELFPYAAKIKLEKCRDFEGLEFKRLKHRTLNNGNE